MVRRNDGPTGEWIHRITLPNDHGQDISVFGRLSAEDMYFNNATGKLTVEKLYATDEGKTAYGLISARGDVRERRAYLMDDLGDGRMVVSNGGISIEVSTDDLLRLLATAFEADQDAETDTVREHICKKLAVND